MPRRRCFWCGRSADFPPATECPADMCDACAREAAPEVPPKLAARLPVNALGAAGVLPLTFAICYPRERYAPAGMPWWLRWLGQPVT